ncbi:hypothetical protein M0804_001960 [Polistes exclamans]|nr:hypothetical protein M0804_001960 [Polistes exclamans]
MESKENLTIALIKEVEKRRLLWDPKHKDYEVRSKRRETWVDICCQLIDNYKELPEHIQDKLLRATRHKWMTIQEIYFVENPFVEMDFEEANGSLSPLGKLLYFIKDIPPMMNSWYHANLESDEMFKNEKKQGITIESETGKKIDVSDVLGKYLSSKLMETDEDWAFLNKLLELMKSLDEEDKSKFRKQIFKCIKKIIEQKEFDLKPNSDLMIGNN